MQGLRDGRRDDDGDHRVTTEEADQIMRACINANAKHIELLKRMNEFNDFMLRVYMMTFNVLLILGIISMEYYLVAKY